MHLSLGFVVFASPTRYTQFYLHIATYQFLVAAPCVSKTFSVYHYSLDLNRICRIFLPEITATTTVTDVSCVSLNLCVQSR